MSQQMWHDKDSSVSDQGCGNSYQYTVYHYDRVKDLGMFTNQLSWSGSCGSVPDFGAGGSDSVPTVSVWCHTFCLVTLGARPTRCLTWICWNGRVDSPTNRWNLRRGECDGVRFLAHLS
jgi:hypothetical protein